jgi:thymidylate synthase (FAD)
MDHENSEIRFSEQGERLVGKYFPVLDKGYVRLVSYHGTDQLVEAAARVSYQKGTRKVGDTRNLIRYLIRAGHGSPLEMPSCIFELKMPLYVIQQLLRHRTAKLNQESHRYSEISGDIQETDRCFWRTQSKDNKQGSDGYLDELDVGCLLSQEESDLLDLSEQVYQNRLKYGVAKEQARKDTPHSTYSSLYWQMDLRNLLHFMGLRCDGHAQLEIRLYANIMAGMVKELFPLTFEAWYDYAFQAVNFTRLDRQLLSFIDLTYGTDECGLLPYISSNIENKKSIGPDVKSYAVDEVGMSSREVTEFFEKISTPDPQDFSLDYENHYVINED